jgi:predicted transcriptional regulator
MDQDQTSGQEMIVLTAELVSAYVGNNSVTAGDLPQLIATVHSALTELGAPKPEPQAEKPVPRMPIKKTITPDYLISLEDGRHYKSLKRHLSGRGMTPADYREKWGLPHDYPMVASNYAAKRSELAKSIGLGRKRTEAAAEAAPAAGKSRRSKQAA